MALTTSVKLDAELKARIQKLADSRRRSAHWVMRDAIEQYVDREERRERLHRDALEAWADFQQTGLHATADEVDAWFAQLEEDEDAEPPACHN